MVYFSASSQHWCVVARASITYTHYGSENRVDSADRLSIADKWECHCRIEAERKFKCQDLLPNWTVLYSCHDDWGSICFHDTYICHVKALFWSWTWSVMILWSHAAWRSDKSCILNCIPVGYSLKQVPPRAQNYIPRMSILTDYMLSDYDNFLNDCTGEGNGGFLFRSHKESLKACNVGVQILLLS